MSSGLVLGRCLRFNSSFIFLRLGTFSLTAVSVIPIFGTRVGAVSVLESRPVCRHVCNLCAFEDLSVWLTAVIPCQRFLRRMSIVIGILPGFALVHSAFIASGTFSFRVHRKRRINFSDACLSASSLVHFRSRRTVFSSPSASILRGVSSPSAMFTEYIVSGTAIFTNNFYSDQLIRY